MFWAPFKEFWSRRARSAPSERAQRGLLCSESCFCHILRTVTRNWARFEALESLFNALSNHEWISSFIDDFYSLILSFIRWCDAQIAHLKPCLRHFITQCSNYEWIPIKEMKNYQMIQYLHKKSIILLCTHLYKKRGIYLKNINKRTDKCH